MLGFTVRFNCHVTRPRNWSTLTWVLLAVSLVAASFILGQTLEFAPPQDAELERGARLAAMAGAVVAVVSLVVTASLTGAVGRRQRRQATIDAWADWSDGTAQHRKLFKAHFGLSQLLSHEAAGLFSKTAPPVDFVDRQGHSMSEEEHRTVKHALTMTLNGLERLAAGINCRVYDRDTLSQLGGTICVRHYEQALPYIELLRTTGELERRQERAYRELEELVSGLKLEQLDRERLRRLRR